ncbi:hypothetical protein R1sor_001915 [Riccia sorocarpa]|uniref:ARM repeat superfamily protein n=1 Tax=Riccia sorocarpa TaxID=122646 RepID=A0ABD3GXN5_9MARC
MDQVFAQIRSDLSSNDGLRQAQALLAALQYSAAGKDVSSLSRIACEEIIASPASAVCKKLAFDLIRSTRLTADQWEIVCRGVKNDFDFQDSDVTAAAVSIVAAIPSWRLGKLISDCSKEISNCLVDNNPNLRYNIVETLGCLLARDDVVTLCESNVTLLERVSTWWKQIGTGMLDASDAVSKVAFEGVGRLFSEFSTKRLSRLAGDKLIPSEAALAIRSGWVSVMCRFVWEKRDFLMARSLILPVENFRATVSPLVFAVKAVTTGMVEEMQAITGQGNSPRSPLEEKDYVNAERILAVSDLVSHLVPFLSSLDPALVFEVAINLLTLADVPGGKPEWAAAPIMSLLNLWDRQEFRAGRESIVRAVVKNLQLLDLHMQVALFKRLLVMVRNLRVDADRMHALACICRTALCVDLFSKESVRRGQKPLPGTDVTSLFEEPMTKDELGNVASNSLFREELVACLVESCFQLSLPLPRIRSKFSESRVVGALAYGTGNEVMNWTQSALEVVEVCRPCVKWNCDGRLYAMDCYLKLLVRLCHIYDTRSGVKKSKDGASPEQILAETRLQALQRQLVKDLSEISTVRLRARVIWALAEHFDLEGLDPLLADDPDDPLNIMVEHIHNILFNVDNAILSNTNRLQDVQAILVCAQHLGSRNIRAAQLLTKELEEFRSSTLADSVNKHQCRLILQVFKYITKNPDAKYVGVGSPTGDYPFTHHKLSVEYFDSSAAQDRKLEDLVHSAVQDLWRPPPSELALLTNKVDVAHLKQPPNTLCLSGSSDPCYVEAYHLTDPNEKRLTLHLKVINMIEQELKRVDVRVGLVGALNFMDGQPQAVRQLPNLISQVPTIASFTVGVSRFERCGLGVQVLYYPHYGVQLSATEEGDGVEEEGVSVGRHRKSFVPEYGEPVVLRCQNYWVPLIELLVPHKCSPVEFFRIWPSLPAIVEYTGAYTYAIGELKLGATSEGGIPSFLTGLKALDNKPFHRVCAHILTTVAGFQLCYAAKSWYGDLLGMVIFGASEVSGDLGEETNTVICKFVLRASSASLLEEIRGSLQEWLDNLTDGSVRVVSDEEMEAASLNKVKRALELLNAPKIVIAPPEPEPDSDDDELVPGMKPPKEPSTLSVNLTAEEIEQKALQSAVLQQWETFRAQYSVP